MRVNPQWQWANHMYLTTKMANPNMPDLNNPYYIPYISLPRTLPESRRQSSSSAQQPNPSIKIDAHSDTQMNKFSSQEPVIPPSNHSSILKSNTTMENNQDAPALDKVSKFKIKQPQISGLVSNKPKITIKSASPKNPGFFINVISAAATPCIGIVLCIAGATMLSLAAAPVLGACLLAGGALLVGAYSIHKFGLFTTQKNSHNTLVSDPNGMLQGDPSLRFG